MIETLKRNAGITGFITTSFFAVLLWWYASQQYNDVPVNYLILIGIGIMLINSVVLWSLTNSKPISRKKGKK